MQIVTRQKQTWSANFDNAILEQNFLKSKGISRIKEIMDEKRAEKNYDFKSRLTTKFIRNHGSYGHLNSYGAPNSSMKAHELPDQVLNNDIKQWFRIEENMKQAYRFKE